jgi:hypothetical protein
VREKRYACPVIRRALMIVGVAAVCAGCTAPVITGALSLAEYGTSTFNSGALETYYPNTDEECIIAVRKTISDLGLRPVVDVPKPDEGFLYLRVKDDAQEEIVFRVRRRSERLTMVRIRVGALGDEPYSSALMKHVTDLLNPAAPPPPGPSPDLREPPKVGPARR